MEPTLLGLNAVTSPSSDIRNQALDGAERVSRRVGITAMSMRLIAKESEVTPGELLGIFRSRTDVLLALLERYRLANGQWMSAQAFPDKGDLDVFVALAERNQSNPSYQALFTMMTAEAAPSEHPAHDVFARRAAVAREFSRDNLSVAQSRGALAPGLDVMATANRLAAAWDGFQILSLYFPDAVSVPASLRTILDIISGNPTQSPEPPRVNGDPVVPPVPEVHPALGADVHKYQRQAILRAAEELFGTRGYSNTTLTRIASEARITKTALLKIFPQKDQLLLAVMQEQDSLLTAWMQSDFDSPRAALERLMDRIQTRLAVPALVPLQNLVCAEGILVDHAAHAYFTSRYRKLLERFEDLFESLAAKDELVHLASPRFHAFWLVALLDGLRIQWVYDRDTDSYMAALREHLKFIMLIKTGRQ